MDPVLSRRAVLGVAGAAAVGLAASDRAVAAPTAPPEQPRLPMNVLLRAGISPEHLEQLRAISPQVTVSRDVPLAEAHAVLGSVSRGVTSLVRIASIRHSSSFWVRAAFT